MSGGNHRATTVLARRGPRWWRPFSVLASCMALVGGVLAAAPAASATPAITVATSWADLATAFNAGGTVLLGADISNVNGAGLTAGSTPVTLDLAGHTLTIIASDSATAIAVTSGQSLTIEDTVGAGTLKARGGGPGAAGIGGGLGWQSAGSITITGGAVTATGGAGGAGIGGAGSGIGSTGNPPATPSGGGGTVTIGGGAVVATGGRFAAGIGGGGGDGTGGSGGTVTIAGGLVTATGGSGAAGIGGGSGGTGGSGGRVTITDSTVHATGGAAGSLAGAGPGIGGGAGAAGTNGGAGGVGGLGAVVKVLGGDVTATGGAGGGAGVGGGMGGPGGTGASGSPGGVGGAGGPASAVTVSGGTLTAAGGVGGGAGVGGGMGGPGGASSSGASGAQGMGAPNDSVTIAAGGVVTASGSGGAFGSGLGTVQGMAGPWSNAGTLTIPAGTTLSALGGNFATNSGTIALAGTLDTSNGAVANSGTIKVSPGGAVTGSGGVTGHNYTLAFDPGTGGTVTPTELHVYAATLTDAGLPLPTPVPPAGRTFTGWTLGATPLAATTDLSTLLATGPSSGTVAAQYQVTSLYTYPGGAAASPTSCPQVTAASSGCSLAQALSLVASGQTVVLAADPGSGSAATFSTTTGWTLSISGVTIQPDSGVTAILDGKSTATYVLRYTGTGTLTVTGITVRGSAGSMNTSTVTGGGGIVNGSSGTLSVSDSTFTANNVSGGYGGGILNWDAGHVSVASSTFVGNDTAPNGLGGGIFNISSGSVSVARSTFVANNSNSTQSNGGGINAAGSGTVTISESTFVGNVELGTAAAAGIHAGNGEVTVAASLLAGDAHDCIGSVTDAGYNIDSDGSCGFTSANHSVSDSAGLAATLNPLGDNGGPTQTVAPQPGSPVVGMIPASTSVTANGQSVTLCPTTDQRGTASATGAACNAGSVQGTVVGLLGAPTALAATPGFGQAALSWTPPVSTGGAPISGYNIYQGTAAGGESTTPVNSSPVTGTSYTATGLSNGTPYYFTVTAVTSAGESPTSNEATATPSKVVTTWPELVAAFAIGGAVQLGADINNVGGASLPVGSTPVTLDLHGQTLSITSNNSAAVQVVSGRSLTIQDTTGGGTLIATANAGGAAGIGGGHGQAAGSITIDSGTVQATGGTYGAGIGGGGGGAGGAVTINGGTVTASGGSVAAGIGSGGYSNPGTTGGTVTINGGTVTASGGSGGAGIGGGAGGDGGAVGAVGATVTISGGTVTANGGANGAGIGGGEGFSPSGNGNDCTPSGGGAAVPCVGGAGGTVTITGGTVTAIGNNGGVGIGGGLATGPSSQGAAGSAVTISSGASVSATGGALGSAFGGGSGTTPGAFGSLSNSGSLALPAGASLTVPAGVTVTDDGLIQLAGTVNLSGTLSGTGTIANAGTIVVASGGSVAGDGLGPAGTALYVSGHNYLLTFDAGAGSAAPATLRVFAKTLQAAALSLSGLTVTPPPYSALSGWFSGATQVTDTTDLNSLFGTGPSGGTLTAHYTSTATAPGAPTGLAATPHLTSVDLSWTAPDSDGGSAIVGYNVFQAGIAAPLNGSPLSGTTFTVTGLTPGTAYSFTVVAVNAVGPSPSSAPTPVTTLPPVVTDITVDATDNTWPGATVGSSAVLTMHGATSDTSDATGTVTFSLYGPAATPACTTGSGGNLIGSATVPLTSATYLSSTGAWTVGSGPVTVPSAGSYYWTASYSGDALYGAGASVCGGAGATSVLAKASQSVVFTSVPPVSPVVGDSYAVSASGGGSGEPIVFSIDASSDAGVCTISGSTVSFTGAGSCVIDADQAGDVNYLPGSAQQTVAVGKANTAGISTSASGNTWPGSTVTDTATLSGLGSNASGTVTFSLFSDASCTAGVGSSTVPLASSMFDAGSGMWSVPSGDVSVPQAGSYYWTASYSGDANFGGVSGSCGDAGETSVLAKASQSVVFTSVPPVSPVVGDSYAVSASGGGSGEPIVFSIDASSDAGVCTISGSTVSFTGAGSCVIDADQAGDVNYLPGSAQQTFTVTATVPDAPTGLAATAGDAQVSLSWAAPTFDGGSAVVGYNVYLGTSAGGESTTPVNASPVAGTGYIVTGLTNGTPYYFTVVAVNSVGSSAPSREAAGTPVATLVVTTETLPGGEVGSTYVSTLAASGGISPYTWSVAGGAVPAGLSLDAATGEITGAPTVEGTASFAITVTDSRNVAADRQLTLTVTAPTCTTAPFNDVDPGSADCGAIKWLAETRISLGFLDGGFHPTEPVTRGAMAALLYRLTHAGQDAPACTADAFPDVPASNVFCGAISWMVQERITIGYLDHTFRPSGTVNKQAMAAFLYRLDHAGQDGGPCQSAPFPDVPAGNVFCGDIAWIADAGIAGAEPGGADFGPTVTVSRATMATVLYRYSQYTLTHPES